jgi:hypothetical protein
MVQAMIALKKTDECALFARVAGPYVDGELDPAHAAGVEVHVLACPECSERVALARAVRKSLKRTAGTSTPRASEALCRRIKIAIAKAAATTGVAKDGDEDEPEKGRAGALPRKSAMAAAALVGFLFAMGAARVRWGDTHGAAGANDNAEPVVASASVTLDKVFDDIIALHRRPPRPETTNPDDVIRFDVDVGVPVRKPALTTFDAKFMGARLYATQKARAVHLQYLVKKNHRVSLYVFDPSVIRMTDAAGLRRRAEGELAVFVGERDGYSIAAAERSGVGIALATDLDSDQSVLLAREALQ